MSTRQTLFWCPLDKPLVNPLCKITSKLFMMICAPLHNIPSKMHNALWFSIHFSTLSVETTFRWLIQAIWCNTGANGYRVEALVATVCTWHLGELHGQDCEWFSNYKWGMLNIILSQMDDVKHSNRNSAICSTGALVHVQNCEYSSL